ncbi:DUF262 domain-containing protein [Chitinophaga sp. Ak27]|uniref:DUF262 domain-containing protein n=1 Tax=Chitinophaga sp. Ak27 TaxID=2726116 RepID=UPI00145DFE75|nr:DUF262 domain-containing protein [Chitinophaga sp. Ak27]NLU96286.1 DUF262 domain-containing protein [Chitinophaga sp. Ak27]
MTDFAIKTYSLRTLKRKFDSKVFAIPEIQRSYVWNKDSICKLMDSIFRNYPIGIALVWDVPPSKAMSIRPNSKTIVPPFNKKRASAELIIDGQQRLSTLYGILKGLSSKEEAGSKINFSEIFFDCRRESEKRFVFNRSYDENTKGFVRLTDLINNRPSELNKQLTLKKWELEQVQLCYEAFHSYKFYVLSFKGFDFEDVREIFIRVNSAGMTITRADNLFALATNVNLRDHLLETRRGLQYGFNNISIDSMQNAIALIYGAERIGGSGFKSFLKSIEDTNAAEKNFLRKWKSIEYGYTQAVDFLVSQFHIKTLKDLPSQNIFSMLAFFFAENGKRANPLQIKQIKKWFWYTCCAERYSGRGFNKNIPIDIKFFKLLCNEASVNYEVTAKVNVYDFLRADYRINSGPTAAYYLMLFNKKPLYLHNGHEILLHNVSSVSNRKDRHHIFPSALLTRNSVNEKWANSITNICFLESDENQSIGSSHPKNYLLKYKGQRHFSKVMNSHLLNVSKNSPLWMNDVKIGFVNFINLRGKAIITEIEKLAGVEIFEKFEYIKRI